MPEYGGHVCSTGRVEAALDTSTADDHTAGRSGCTNGRRCDRQYQPERSAPNSAGLERARCVRVSRAHWLQADPSSLLPWKADSSSRSGAWRHAQGMSHTALYSCAYAIRDSTMYYGVLVLRTTYVLLLYYTVLHTVQ